MRQCPLLSKPLWPYSQLVGLILALLAGNNLQQSAMAECRAHYREAKTLLETTTRKAANNEHPDANLFAKAFQHHVEMLQAEKCMPELMSLMQYIQAEQKKYPQAPPDLDTD